MSIVDTVSEVRSFEAFFREEYTAVVALCAWLTGDQAAGEDLAQDAMEAAHRRWDEIGRFERPDAFVRRAAVNLASNERRRRARRDGALRRLRAVPDRHERGPSARDEELWQHVAALPFQQRAAIGLRYLEDRSTAEIAAALGCSEATVRVHLHRAHRTLAGGLGRSTDATSDPLAEEETA